MPEMAFSPLLVSLPIIAVPAPPPARAIAIPRPMPLLPPVMTAVLPDRSNFFIIYILFPKKIYSGIYFTIF
jgi:hypothetical protein